jgi:hypothetical protein
MESTLQRDILTAAVMVAALFGLIVMSIYSGLIAPAHLLHHGASVAMRTEMRR